MDPRTKQELLDHYSDKEPHLFWQWDGFNEQWGDNVTGHDEDGHQVFGSETYELMSGFPAVRVLVEPGTSKEDALALLSKITGRVKESGITGRDNDGPNVRASYLGIQALPPTEEQT